MKTGYNNLRLSLRPLAAIFAAAFVFVLAACGSGSGGSVSSATSAPPCPTAPVKVVVTTNVWGSVVDQLVGTCANVSTVITNSTADPHDFEPTAETSASFAGAQLVVMNGLGYDEWAMKIIKSLGSSAPPVLNLGQAIGLELGANPHIWYSPDYVIRAASAVTSRMKSVSQSGASYFDAQAATFGEALKPYLAKVAAIRQQFNGTQVGSTETLFDYMAAATGLVITTPPGFVTAIATGSEPAAADVAQFRTQLTNGTDKVLIYNSQTEGGLTNQMRELAQTNKVPVVNVTESLNPATATFQAWQLAQLDALASALTR
jgi:zinc/manganese transport system substrate-binding protein